MNSYAKVRTPNSNKSKSISDQAEPKQTEISLNIKQPFKLSRPGIEQPKLRVNNAPSVVHIIERKANKIDQSKISSAQSERIHVIQPSSAKKAWRFNLNQDYQDQHLPDNAKEEKYSQEVMAPLPQQKIQAPIVNLPQNYESLSDPKGKMAYQRRLERALSQSASQNSKKSSQSVMQESSVHHLDIGQPIKIQNIHLQEVVEIYRNADKKSLQRNLALSEEWIPQKEQKIKSSLMYDEPNLIQAIQMNEQLNYHSNKIKIMRKILPTYEAMIFGENNRIQVYQINEQFNRPSDKIKLKRNIEGIREEESSIYYNEPQQIFLEQRRESRSSQRKSMMVIQDNEGKVRDIFIPDDYQENREHSKVGNQIRRLWILEDKDNINEIINQKQDIFIGQDYQQGNSKADSFNHKRLMSHSRALDEEKDIKIQNSPLQRPLSQSVHLKSIEEQLQDNRPSLKQMRKLVIIEDHTGNHQIFVPEQFQQSRSEFLPTSQKRSVNPVHLSSKNQIKVSNIPPPQQPLSQSIHLSSVQEGFYDDKRSSKLQRKLLILEDKDGKQEIFVPQQVEDYDRERDFINHHRKISSSQVIGQKQMRVSNLAPPLSERIDLQSLHQDFNKEKRLSSKLQRRLLNLEQDNRVQQIFLPEQSQAFGQQIFFQNHKRSISSSQPFEKKAERVSYARSAPQEINVQSLHENWQDGNRSSKYLRKIILVQDNRNISQEIFLPEQIEQSRQGATSVNHIRNISHSLKASNRLPQGQSVDLYSLQEQLADSKRLSKNKRNLLIKEGSVGEQQIFINQQYQNNPQRMNAVNQRRSLANSERLSQKQEKIASRPIKVLPEQQKIDLSQVFQQIDPRQVGSKHSRKLLVLQEKNGKLMAQQIHISSQIVSSHKAKSLQNHRRVIAHTQELNASRKPSQKAQNLPQMQQGKSDELIVQQINMNDELKYSLKSKALMSQKRTVMKSQQKSQNAPKMQQVHSLQIDSIEEMWDSNRRNSKLSRKLLILQNKKGQILAQQITIPQQLEQKDHTNDLSSHKRELRLMKLQEEPKPQSNNFSHLNIQAQNFDYSPYKSSNLKMSRNLLLIKEQSGKQIYQQVIIPQDFEVKQATISNIHYKRQILNDYEPKMEKQQKINGRIPPPNEIQYEQVLIPSDLQQKSSQRFVQSHRRTVKHLQALPQPKDQPQDIIEEPVIYEPLQIQQIIEVYSSKSKKSKQSRNLLVIQQPNGKVLTQEIIIPEDFSQSKHQQQPKMEHKRHFKIITFEDEPKINVQIPIPNQKKAPMDDIVINSVEQNYKPSQNSQKTSRNLLAIKNSDGETLYQEIFLPDMQQSKQGQSLVGSHKRQFKIVTVEEAYLQQQQQEKPIKINNHPLPQAQQIHVEEIYESSNIDERVNRKYKRALLLAINQEGKVVSQQIQIPDQNDQMAYNQRPSTNHQRNIRHHDTLPPRAPSFPPENISIPQEIYMNNAERGPMNYKRQIKPSQLKISHGLPLNSPQVSQDVHDEGSRNQIFPEKSFNPSTLNSSQVQNLNFNASLEQSRASPDSRPLTRSLAPCPEKLSQSEDSDDPHERFFDVYSPRSFLHGKLLAGQMSFHTPIHNVDRPLKPHRRPGFP